MNKYHSEPMWTRSYVREFGSNSKRTQIVNAYENASTKEHYVVLNI